MTTNQEADALWKKIEQAGISYQDLCWIKENAPSYLDNAWTVFSRQANKTELIGTLLYIAPLQEKAWEKLRPQVTQADLLKILCGCYLEEPLRLFAQQATAQEAARLMDENTEGPVRQQCWQIIKQSGNSWYMATAMDSQSARGDTELRQNIWKALRPRATPGDLQYVIKNFDQYRDEAWKDLKKIGTTQDFRQVLTWRSFDKTYDTIRLEAAEMLLENVPSAEILIQIIKETPRPERKVKVGWFRQKIVETLPPQVEAAIRKLVEMDITINRLYWLREHAICGQPSLQETVERKIKEHKQESQSPTQKLLEKLKRKENK